MTEHTPTPWFKNRKFEIGPRPRTDDQSDGMLHPIADVFGDNREADAAFIVKACNAFPDLVKARATFLGYLQAENGCRRTGTACRETCACELELQGLVEAWGNVVVKQVSTP